MAEHATKSKHWEGKTKGDQHDFSTWVQSNNLDSEIVSRLKEEELDDIELLKRFSATEINTLGLTPEQEVTFCKALHRLQGREDIENELDTWAADHGVNVDTMQKLKSGGVDNLQKLTQTNNDDLTKLKIKAGQRLKLTEAIANLKDSQNNKEDCCPDTNDSAFVMLLREKQIKDETIKKLLTKDYDSTDVLRMMEKEEVLELKLSKPQQRILLDIIRTLKEAAKLTYGQVFEQFLKELSIKEASIKILKEYGIDSPETLMLLNKENIDELKLKSEQRKQLEDVISQLLIIHEDQDHDFTKNSANEPRSSKNVKPEQLQIEERSVIGALSRLKDQTKDEPTTGISNLIAYLKSAESKDRPKKIRMQNGMNIMKVPVTHVYQESRGKVRRCIIGKPDLNKKLKTIMTVGATGAGKSTLIDGICNYIFGTRWDENSRFKLIDEHEEELKNAKKGQTMSQTEWITIYTIHSGCSNRLPYTLNLIDTPGFGDTRGVSRDQKLIEQIRALFLNRGSHDIDELDAVCFVAKAPDARLTPTQRYIFHSILSVFGKDIEENILVMITFADGAKAPVLEAINESKLPHRRTFPFNNSALFENNGNSADPRLNSSTHGRPGSAVRARKATTDFGKMFWDMGEKSFLNFFEFLGTLSPQSLCLTSEVLEKRQNLRDTLDTLQTKVRIGLSTMEQLERENKIVRDNENKIEDNKNFTYTVTKHLSVKVNCEAGRNVTHCMHCHETCHPNCIYRDDDDKAKCMAMDKTTGKCKICKNNCMWGEHKNTGYYLVAKTEEIEQTWENKLKEYKEATGKAAKSKDIIKDIEKKKCTCESEVRKTVGKCCTILQRLRKIALKPDPLTEIDYIEELIRTEKNERETGWDGRVRQLEKLKDEAETIRKVKTGAKLL